MGPGQPLKFKSNKELQKKIDEYFDYADKKDKPYTITGLCLFLDCDRKTLINYSEKEEYFHTIKKAKLKIENYAEESLYVTKNVAGVIFNLKNNYGWVDKQEIEADVKADTNLNVNIKVID